MFRWAPPYIHHVGGPAKILGGSLVLMGDVERVAKVEGGREREG